MDRTKLLEENHITVQCQSPFEIADDFSGDTATGVLANLVADSFEYQAIITKLEIWLRFFTRNQTNQVVLFDMLDPTYDKAARVVAATEISEYFLEKDRI